MPRGVWMYITYVIWIVFLSSNVAQTHSNTFYFYCMKDVVCVHGVCMWCLHGVYVRGRRARFVCLWCVTWRNCHLVIERSLISSVDWTLVRTEKVGSLFVVLYSAVEVVFVMSRQLMALYVILCSCITSHVIGRSCGMCIGVLVF